MLNEASIPFIQSPCLPSLVPILSPPPYVLIVCVEELLDIYPRGGMVPMKSNHNFLSPYIRKLQFTVIRLSCFFSCFKRRHQSFNILCPFANSLNVTSRKKTFIFSIFIFYRLCLGLWLWECCIIVNLNYKSTKCKTYIQNMLFWSFLKTRSKILCWYFYYAKQIIMQC